MLGGELRLRHGRRACECLARLRLGRELLSQALALVDHHVSHDLRRVAPLEPFALALLEQLLNAFGCALQLLLEQIVVDLTSKSLMLEILS